MNTTATPLHIQTDIAELSGFNDLSAEEQLELLDELGSLALENALLRYLLMIDETEQRGFELYVQAHIGEENFLQLLYKDFPEFEKILTEEMGAIQKESEEFLRDL